MLIPILTKFQGATSRHSIAWLGSLHFWPSTWERTERSSRWSDRLSRLSSCGKDWPNTKSLQWVVSWSNGIEDASTFGCLPAFCWFLCWFWSSYTLLSAWAFSWKSGGFMSQGLWIGGKWYYKHWDTSPDAAAIDARDESGTWRFESEKYGSGKYQTTQDTRLNWIRLLVPGVFYKCLPLSWLMLLSALYLSGERTCCAKMWHFGLILSTVLFTWWSLVVCGLLVQPPVSKKGAIPFEFPSWASASHTIPHFLKGIFNPPSPVEIYCTAQPKDQSHRFWMLQTFQGGRLLGLPSQGTCSRHHPLLCRAGSSRRAFTTLWFGIILLCCLDKR